MSLQPVPWAIGHGAENSVEGARLSLYAATKGGTGIIEPADMRVQALPTPGAAVRVLSGSCVVKSTYPGATAQSYAMRETGSTDVPVPATGSSGGATRYLVARIKDDQYVGQPPADVAAGPYNEYAIVSSLGGSHPFVPLAKIVQPANTATITADMITDLREMADLKTKIVPFARPRIMADNSPQNYLTARDKDGGEYFPGGGGSPNSERIDVPVWANRMIIASEWVQVRYEGGLNGWGYYWMEWGTEFKDRGWTNKQSYEFASQKFMWDAPYNAGTNRNSWILRDHAYIPAKLRGKSITMVFKASNVNDTNAKSKTASMDALSGLAFSVFFAQDPDATWEDPIQ